jgi:hypothetical protein
MEIVYVNYDKNKKDVDYILHEFYKHIMKANTV